MYRKISYLLFFLAFLILFSMGSTTLVTDEAIVITEDESESYTLEELSLYNGKNNQPAYIVIDGIVYDVTHVEEWKDKFQGDYPAGEDVSEAIKDNLIKEVILEKAPEVGVLE